MSVANSWLARGAGGLPEIRGFLQRAWRRRGFAFGVWMGIFGIGGGSLINSEIPIAIVSAFSADSLRTGGFFADPRTVAARTARDETDRRGRVLSLPRLIFSLPQHGQWLGGIRCGFGGGGGAHLCGGGGGAHLCGGGGGVGLGFRSWVIPCTMVRVISTPSLGP